MQSFAIVSVSDLSDLAICSLWNSNTMPYDWKKRVCHLITFSIPFIT